MEKKLTISEAFKLALKNQKKNNIKSSISIYKKILKIKPNHLPSLNNLGTLLKGRGEYQKAKDCFEKAIEVDSNFLDAKNNLATIFIELGEYIKAENLLNRIIKINPNNINAHINLGHTFEKLKNYQKSIDCFEKAIKLDSNNVLAITNLAISYEKSGNLNKVLSCYNKLDEINPNDLGSIIFLGLKCYQTLGDYKKAFAYFHKAIKIDSDNIIAIHALAELFRIIKEDFYTEKNNKYLKEILISLYSNNNIAHGDITSALINVLFVKEYDGSIHKIINLESSLLKNHIIQKLIKDELLHLVIQKSVINGFFFEKLLTKLRNEIISTLESINNNNLKEYFNFIISLAEQCWLNEYLFVQSDEETSHVNRLKIRIENNDKINELDIAILACYIPLTSSKVITNKLLNYKSINILFNDLINLQIKEPLKEAELIKNINSLHNINDSVSKKVQLQYEEYPYPRWRYAYRFSPINFFDLLRHSLKPNIVNSSNKFISPNVLIAGCGTGKHAIQATRYKNANVLCVDLSLSSLAYATRKTNELDYKNLTFLHADILELKNLDRKFDVIESSGTIHHMKDPVAGLNVLADILEPHGFLKLGLYSKTGRQDITRAKELIKKKDFKKSSTDIKIYRQEIIKDESFKIFNHHNDFYSTSGVKDLLFNIQEYYFTIPEISKILKDLNLEFLGFTFRNDLIKNKFSELFPNDKKNISLDNWHKFETDNPNTFEEMYQFWVRKIF